MRVEPIAERHREGLREAAEREPQIHRYTNMYTLGFDGWFDLALASAKNPSGTYNLYVASLNLGSVNVATSIDNGTTFSQTPGPGGHPGRRSAGRARTRVTRCRSPAPRSVTPTTEPSLS